VQNKVSNKRTNESKEREMKGKGLHAKKMIEEMKLCGGMMHN
jgi:hypothetical protein